MAWRTPRQPRCVATAWTAGFTACPQACPDPWGKLPRDPCSGPATCVRACGSRTSSGPLSPAAPSMPRRRPSPPPLTLMPPEAAPPIAPRLALGGGGGVRLVLEAGDAAAVEAAAAALKARFGTRFAVTARRRERDGLRLTASLQVSADEALDAGTRESEA